MRFTKFLSPFKKISTTRRKKRNIKRKKRLNKTVYKRMRGG